MNSRERSRVTGSKGAALFKGGGGGTSAADKFQDSAHRRVAEAQAREEQLKAEEAKEEETGKHTFSAKPASHIAKKRKKGAAAASGVGAKASKNTAMLSFSEED